MKQRTVQSKLYLPIILILGFVFALLFMPGQGWGQEIDPPGGADSPDQDHTVFLPFVTRPGNRIYGFVTDGGVPASGVELALQLFNGVSSTTVVTTTTGIDGRYLFHNIPPLLPDTSYYVEYFNLSDPTNLFLWQTRELGTFTSTSVEHIGDFDLANVGLIAPEDFALINLPHTFEWTPRLATPTDTYFLGLYDGTMNPIEPVGNAGSYELASLPAGFQICTPYQWGVVIASPDGGIGISGSAYLVTFYTSAPSGIHGCVTYNNGPASAVTVSLINGDVTEASAVTNASGYFHFDGASPLGAGEEYHVLYNNAGDQNRLGGYLTQGLSSYITGDTVHIGDFDITDIDLLSPPEASMLPLPISFSWEPAPIWNFQGYALEIFGDNFDPYFGDFSFETNYELTVLPPEFLNNTLYGWDAGIFDWFGGFGWSFTIRGIQILSPGMNESLSSESFSPAQDPEIRHRMRQREGVQVNPQMQRLQLRERTRLRLDR